MGCSQSKATDLVVERVSAEAPAADVPATTEVAVEQPEEAVVEASGEAAAAPDQGEEQAEAAAEEPKEEAPAPVEAVAEETLAPVEEEPKEEAVAPTEEVAEEAAPVEEPEEEAAAPVEEAAESTPVVDDAPEVVAEETTPTPEAEAEAAAPVEEAAAAEEESAAVESAPKSQVEVVSGDEKPAASGVTFASGDVSFDDKGVAFYNIQGSDPEDPAKDVRVSKRYSEFKALHAEIARVLAASQEDKSQPTPALPAMPKASFLHRRTNKKMLEERETQFVAMLNAIASHPAAAQSEVFATFVA